MTEVGAVLATFSLLMQEHHEKRCLCSEMDWKTAQECAMDEILSSSLTGSFTKEHMLFLKSFVSPKLYKLFKKDKTDLLCSTEKVLHEKWVSYHRIESDDYHVLVLGLLSYGESDYATYHRFQFTTAQMISFLEKTYPLFDVKELQKEAIIRTMKVIF